jgi:molybdopterin/thiamine biosynthesis adenylyltransferase
MGSVDVVSGENWNRYSDHVDLSAAFDTALFDRQARLLGEAGQAIISNMKIGIVGCGGIGSVAATLLVHSGIRNFTLIDFDHAEPSNLPRLLGATYDDAHHFIRKTDILQKVIKAVCPEAVVRTLEAPVEDPVLLQALVGLDAIVCGTDDTTSRAFLNQLCHQYYVPLLDLGVQFVVDPGTGKVVSNVGKINFMRPGDPCLLCIGHVNPQVLAEEALDKETREHRRNEGYLRGSDVHEPAMMTFNMQVAARGVQALLSWFSGFQSIAVEQFERYDFLGTANRGLSSFTRKRRYHGCPLCGPDGQLLGRGDAHPMVVSPRPRVSVSAKQI